MLNYYNTEAEDPEYEKMMQMRQQRAQADQLKGAQPQQQQQSINPMQAMNMYQQFAGGGGAAGGEGAGMAGIANPWTALGAGIIANEREGIRGGYRDENVGEYAKDLVTGSVLQQDIAKRWSPKMFGKDDKYGLGGDMDMASEFASGDLSHGFKKMKDTSLGKALRKIF